MNRTPMQTAERALCVLLAFLALLLVFCQIERARTPEDQDRAALRRLYGVTHR